MELQSLRSMARCTNYRHQMPGQERTVCPMDARSHERAAMGPALVLEAQDGMDSGWKGQGEGWTEGPGRNICSSRWVSCHKATSRAA